VSPDVVNLPFFHITDDESQTLAAERIVQRYGQMGTWRPVCCAREIASAQANQKLDVAAVKSILVTPQFHLTMDVRLSDRANTSDIDVTVESWPQIFVEAGRHIWTSHARHDGIQLKVVARGGARTIVW